MKMNSEVMELLYVMAGILGFLLIILVFLYFTINKKEKNKVNNNEKIENKELSGETSTQKSNIKTFTLGSVFDFIEFDKIIDNMISQKKGKKYSMVIECQGINFDLMSEEEQVAVEEGFIQFLNTLQNKVQLYVQTRTINLESSIKGYKERLEEIERDYNKQKMKYQQALIKNVSDTEIRREYYELIKKQNLFEYTQDIIYNTEKMSLNRHMLAKKYYVIVSYFTAEIEENNLDKEELKEMAFSELYTRCQSLIRALGTSGVIGKILTSTELVDLLYMAYNRDDAEIYGIEKAMRARYDELYSTAPDYMEKKIELLDQEIERNANKMVNEKISQARSELQREYDERQKRLDELTAEYAKEIIEENKNIIGEGLANIAIEKINDQKDEKHKKKGGKVDEE